MFLILICNAIRTLFESLTKIKLKTAAVKNLVVSIAIYEAKKQNYPKTEKEWDSYDGILIPGYFSGAYDSDDWIRTRMKVIQDDINGKRRKTLAVCFGHQVYAHSFYDIDRISTSHEKSNSKKDERVPVVVACPLGTLVGRRNLSPSGTTHLCSAHAGRLSLLYTHGDMVASLLSCAVNLGGTESVPIQAAAYFPSADGAGLFRVNVRDHTYRKTSLPLPYVFTFQAHPEFTSDMGNLTFYNGLNLLGESGLPFEKLKKAKNDALGNIVTIEEDCINTMITVGSLLD